MSNSTTTANKSSRKGSKMDSSMKRQSLETLTVSSSPVLLKNTGELSRYLALAFPANHSARLASKGAKKTTATSGRKRFNVFAIFDPDTCGWKTSQVCLILDTLAKSSLRWPKQGMMHDGLCSEQTSVAHHIDVGGSGYWPTPRASDGLRDRMSMATHLKMSKREDGGFQTLHTQVAKVEDASTGQMNPEWVESFLMGWPMGWTGLQPLAMGKFQEWLQQHGES